MAVTVKAFCSSKTIYSQSYGNASLHTGAQFRFQVDYSDGRNKEWAQATPTFSLEMTVNNANMFEVGKGYTLTFEPDEN